MRIGLWFVTQINFVFILTVALTTIPAFGQSLPTGTITLICPYPAGTGIDIVARIIVQKLAESWGQPVVVKNLSGASGNIGAMAAANAKPDGSTFIIIANSHLINQHVSKNIVDVQKALTPVALAGMIPYLIAVSNLLPVQTLPELIKLAKAKPGEINYSGIRGSVPHFLGVAMNTAGNIDMKFIAYKSTTEPIADVVSGRVPVWFTTVASALPLVQAGSVRVLAVTGSKTVSLLPSTPTAASVGFPTLDLNAAFYIMAPIGTPRPIIDRVNRDITGTMKMRDVVDSLALHGAEATTSTPDELGNLLKRETTRWAELVKFSGITTE